MVKTRVIYDSDSDDTPYNTIPEYLNSSKKSNTALLTTRGGGVSTKINHKKANQNRRSDLAAIIPKNNNRRIPTVISASRLSKPKSNFYNNLPILSPKIKNTISYISANCKNDVNNTIQLARAKPIDGKFELSKSFSAIEANNSKIYNEHNENNYNRINKTDYSQALTPTKRIPSKIAYNTLNNPFKLSSNNTNTHQSSNSSDNSETSLSHNNSSSAETSSTHNNNSSPETSSSQNFQLGNSISLDMLQKTSELEVFDKIICSSDSKSDMSPNVISKSNIPKNYTKYSSNKQQNSDPEKKNTDHTIQNNPAQYMDQYSESGDSNSDNSGDKNKTYDSTTIYDRENSSCNPNMGFNSSKNNLIENQISTGYISSKKNALSCAEVSDSSDSDTNSKDKDPYSAKSLLGYKNKHTQSSLSNSRSAKLRRVASAMHTSNQLSKYNLRSRPSAQMDEMKKTTKLILKYEKYHNSISNEYGKYKLRFKKPPQKNMKKNSVNSVSSQNNISERQNSLNNNNSALSHKNKNTQLPLDLTKRSRNRVKSYTNKNDKLKSHSFSSSSSEPEGSGLSKINILPFNYDKIMQARSNNSSGAQQNFLEASNQHESSTTEHKVNFDQIGGLKDHIRTVKEVVVLPLLYPEICSRFSLRPPRGLLFHGPPGTGKTLLARALANSCSSQAKPVAFFIIRGSECLSKFIGEGERHLRLIFDTAKKFQPSIVFFDEIDGLAPTRNSRHDQSHISIVTTLLTLMDGLEDRGQVIVIGATNRLDSVDPALRRPGRFDRELYFGYPDFESRKQIIEIHTKKWPSLPRNDLLELIANKTSGWGGAEIISLMNEIVMAAVRRHFPLLQDHTTKEKLNVNLINISDSDILDTLNLRDQVTTSDDNISILNPLFENILSQVNDIIITAKRNNFMGTARIMITGGISMGQEVFRQALVQKLVETKVKAYILNPLELLVNDQLSPESKICLAFKNAKRYGGIIIVSGINDWIREEWVLTFNQCLSELIGSTSAGLIVIGETPIPSWIERVDKLIGRFRFSLNSYTEDDIYNFFSPIINLALSPISSDLNVSNFVDIPDLHIKQNDGRLKCLCTASYCPCKSSKAYGSIKYNSAVCKINGNNIGAVNKENIFSEKDAFTLLKLQKVLDQVLNNLISEPRLKNIIDPKGFTKDSEVVFQLASSFSLSSLIEKNKKTTYTCVQHFLSEVVLLSDKIFILGGIKALKEAKRKNWYKSCTENKNELKLAQKALIKIVLEAITSSNTSIIELFKCIISNDSNEKANAQNDGKKNIFDNVILNLENSDAKVNLSLDLINDSRLKLVEHCSSRGILALKYGFADEDRIKSVLLLLDIVKSNIMQLVDIDLLISTRNIALRYSGDLNDAENNNIKHNLHTGLLTEALDNFTEAGNKSNKLEFQSEQYGNKVKAYNDRYDENECFEQVNMQSSNFKPMSNKRPQSIVQIEINRDLDFKIQNGFTCDNLKELEEGRYTHCTCASNPLTDAVVSTSQHIVNLFKEDLIPFVALNTTIEELEKLHMELYSSMLELRKQYKPDLSAAWAECVTKCLKGVVYK
ncbi:hypothetical protein BB561_003972 [Smittium simulii]|uniref:AAA+ ATPase domain-containing protein n=1 Tax=Smittium simulii TaxID=133385 RepID=A0A2T9YIL2_9FUNG|nr:hypothetical protein BB561_003972 [Smittium simulii]